MTADPQSRSAVPTAQPNTDPNSGSTQKRAIKMSTAPLNGTIRRATSGTLTIDTPAIALAIEYKVRKTRTVVAERSTKAANNFRVTEPSQGTPLPQLRINPTRHARQAFEWDNIR